MKRFELYTRNAMSRTITKLLKEKKITQKHMICILHTTRERYVKYALKGYPSEQLGIILQVLDINIFEFMEHVDLDIREFHANSVPPIKIEKFHNNKPPYEALYQVIKEYWLALNPTTIELLEAWIDEYSPYYLYLSIVKQSFITQNDLNLIDKYRFNIHDYIICIYYSLTYEEIEAIYKKHNSNIYFYLINKQLTTFYKRHAKQNNQSSLQVLIKLAEKTLP